MMEMRHKNDTRQKHVQYKCLDFDIQCVFVVIYYCLTVFITGDKVDIGFVNVAKKCAW